MALWRDSKKLTLSTRYANIYWFYGKKIVLTSTYVSDGLINANKKTSDILPKDFFLFVYLKFLFLNKLCPADFIIRAIDIES